MDQRVIDFVKPLYLDLDGVSHFDEVERVSRIARELYDGSDPARLDLLLLFQGLRRWLEKVGNFSRTLLVLQGSVSEDQLRSILQSLSRLETPVSREEVALAAALVVERAGVNALVRRFLAGRKLGQTPLDIARDILSRHEDSPEWLTEGARQMLRARRESVRQLCNAMIEEA